MMMDTRKQSQVETSRVANDNKTFTPINMIIVDFEGEGFYSIDT